MSYSFNDLCAKGNYDDIEEAIDNDNIYIDLDEGLDTASWNGHDNIVELLLKEGAENYNKAYENACKFNYENMGDMIIDYVTNNTYIYSEELEELLKTACKYGKGHTINLYGCKNITNKGLENLKGVNTINVYGCINITNKGLEHLKGIQTINIY